MSGLCGWLNLAREPGDGAASRQLLGRMAETMARFDGSEVHGAVLPGGAVAAAVAARQDSVHLHQADGLLVAVWGRPRIAGHDGNAARHLALLWRERGAQACAALSGPFALCVLDSTQGQAWLAVDRQSSLPLCYQSTPRGLLFASSADALLVHPDAGRDVDPQAIFDYLYFHMVPAPRSVYRGQQRLRPGEYLHYQRGKLTRQRYWTMRFDEERAPPFRPQRARFLDTLQTAVRETLGEHKVGAFLSGGTDSSTLAWALGQVSGAPASTYSIGFEAPGYDELDYARIASQHFGCRHHELYVTADDVVAAIPRLAAVFDQPFGNASALPAYYCARMARADGVTRLLGGDGGDELFGGNERYARQAVFSRYERLPAALRQLLLEPLLFGLLGEVRLGALRKGRSYIRQALVPMPARLETYNLLQCYGPGQVLEADFLAGIDSTAPLAQLNEAYWGTRELSQINQMLALDLQYTLADNDLPKVSKACELGGLEPAFPFLNDAMVAFAAALPPQDKLRGTTLRPFFKRALSDILPGAILRKKKHGFGLPFGYWLQSHADLRAIAFDSLSDLKARRIVRAGFIDALLQTHLSQHPAYHGTMVWVLMMLEQWFRQRDATERAPEETRDEFEIPQG